MSRKYEIVRKAIFCDGEQMTLEEIVDRLREWGQLKNHNNSKTNRIKKLQKQIDVLHEKLFSLPNGDSKK